MMNEKPVIMVQVS